MTRGERKRVRRFVNSLRVPDAGAQPLDGLYAPQPDVASLARALRARREEVSDAD